jgi:hypothetical protein
MKRSKKLGGACSAVHTTEAKAGIQLLKWVTRRTRKRYPQAWRDAVHAGDLDEGIEGVQLGIPFPTQYLCLARVTLPAELYEPKYSISVPTKSSQSARMALLREIEGYPSSIQTCEFLQLCGLHDLRLLYVRSCSFWTFVRGFWRLWSMNFRPPQASEKEGKQ